MNCNNFEAIISDLAREQMLDAALRQGALAHVEECEECAGLLETERALTRGLRAFEAADERLEAPAHVEANLLARFRERTAAQNSPVVVPMPERVSRRRPWWYAQAAAAAVLLMFAIGGAIALRVRQAPASQPGATAGNRTELVSTPASSDSVTPPATVNAGDAATATAATPENSKDREHGQKLSKGEVAALLDSTPRRSNVQSVRRPTVNESRMASTGNEIATDFMPVSYGDNLNEIDNGRIVRVEMPRSALAQFGLPVNMDRANERIKADVLIGDDGMARAIRFVR
jgi:hypothetical protein